MIRAKVIGAGGYGGVGIVELLMGHPEAKPAVLVDVENTGIPLGKLYPHLAGFIDLPLVSPDSAEAAEPTEVTFTATPDGVGMKIARTELEKGGKMVDYSGDFRFNSEEAYAEYARRIGREPRHAAPDLLPRSVYGLPELHRKELTPETTLVGNPGCFAVACILGLAPALKAGATATEGVICDCTTGVSGAGKKPHPVFHFPARYEQMNAYKLAGHQHVCEIERELSLATGKKIKVTFTAHVVPLCRGIMATLYGRLVRSVSEQELLEMYRDFYHDSGFVRVYESTAAVGTRDVRGTNYCNLTISVDERTGMMRIVSHIDNLLKGQAGSAMQNMNLLFGLPETMGLDRPAAYP